MTQQKYPISYLFTMLTELLHEMNLDQYTVLDVRSFGHTFDEGPDGAMFVEVFTRDESGQKTGTERIVRWIERDTSYEVWGNGPIPGVVG